jgi:hypothetical protein
MLSGFGGKRALFQRKAMRMGSSCTTSTSTPLAG